MRGQTCGMNCHEIHMEYEDAQERRQRQECKSAKDGAPSAKVRAPSAKVRAPSAKVRVPSAKVRVPSVKVQAPTDSSGRKLPRSQVRPRGGQGEAKARGGAVQTTSDGVERLGSFGLAPARPLLTNYVSVPRALLAYVRTNGGWRADGGGRAQLEIFCRQDKPLSTSTKKAAA
jgi:hypothetical protein